MEEFLSEDNTNLQSQGAKANQSGAMHEKTVEDALTGLYCEKKDSSFLKEIDLNTYEKHFFISQPKFQNIYGSNSRADLLAFLGKNKVIRIECKKQESAGSVDEKIPFALINFFETSLCDIQENFCILVLEGEHFLNSTKGNSIIDWAIEDIRKKNKYFQKKHINKKIFLAKGQNELENLLLDIFDGKVTI